MTNGSKKQSSVQSCKPATGTVWVSVKYSGTVAGVAGTAVTLAGPSPGQGNTDGAGLVKFDARTPGAYTVSATLPGNRQAGHRIEPFGARTAVAGGDIAVVDVDVSTVGTLEVKVVDDRAPPQAVQGVAISVSGPESVEARSPAGAHRFANVRTGRYSVSVRAERGDLYGPPTASADGFVVPTGGSVTAQLQLVLLNVVSPVIDIVPPPAPRKANEVWFVAADHSAAAQTAGFQEHPLELTFKFLESNTAKPYRGGGTISWDPGIRLFSDPACQNAVAAQTQSVRVAHGALAATHRLWAKGASGGTPAVHLALDEAGQAAGISVRAPVNRPLVVEEVVVATPKLALEYKVVMFDRDLAQHQTANGEPPYTLLRPAPTRVEVSIEHSGDGARYAKEATLAAPNCAIFLDAACTRPLNRKLTAAELTATPPTSVYLRGTTRGLFNLTLTLDPSGDPRVLAAGPATEPMGVVELRLDLHRHDASGVRVAATTYPLAGHCADFERANLIPPQVVMSDADKVRATRLLHVQSNGDFGRAKVIVKQLVAAQWPAGTDDYDIVLQTGGTGGLHAFDAETKGHEKKLPLHIKVSALKTADQTVWVEGSEASAIRGGTRLELGVDRAPGGIAKQRKLHGDWGRFTVVKIEAVEVVAPVGGGAARWDAGSNRFFINFEAGDDARKLKLRARLSQPIRDVPIHFMLSPSEHNLKKRNWGADLPGTWPWDSIADGLKHRDKAARVNLLHLSQDTDAMGTAEKEVFLSRFAGDVFRPAAYLDQDPHLATHVHGHATLGKRRPVRAAHNVAVWRKFWYQMSKAQGFEPPQPTAAESAYEAVRSEMVLAQTVDFTQATAPARTFYPKYMIDAGGGSSADLVANIGDYNKHGLKTLMPAPDAAMPVKRHLMVCTYQYDSLSRGALNHANGQSGAVKNGTTTSVMIEMDAVVLDPPLHGAASFVERLYWYRQSAPGVRTNIPFGNASIPNPRRNNQTIMVTLPAINPPPTRADPVFVVAKCFAPHGPFLGESFDSRNTMIVYDPKDVTDYNDTVVHEIGHSMNQTPRTGTQPDSGNIPDHPNMADRGQGNHCQENDGRALFSGETKFKCVMYDSGPMKYGLHRFCPVCHPYLLVEDFHKP